MTKSTHSQEKQTPRFKRVYLEWVDAESDPEWNTLDKVKHWSEKDCYVFEIGWIVTENKKYVTICSQITEDGDLGNKTKIPKAWIKRKKKL